jgi:hypothetical protein
VHGPFRLWGDPGTLAPNAVKNGPLGTAGPDPPAIHRRRRSGAARTVADGRTDSPRSVPSPAIALRASEHQPIYGNSRFSVALIAHTRTVSTDLAL